MVFRDEEDSFIVLDVEASGAELDSKVDEVTSLEMEASGPDEVVWIFSDVVGEVSDDVSTAELLNLVSSTDEGTVTLDRLEEVVSVVSAEEKVVDVVSEEELAGSSVLVSVVGSPFNDVEVSNSNDRVGVVRITGGTSSEESTVVLASQPPSHSSDLVEDDEVEDDELEVEYSVDETTGEVCSVTVDELTGVLRDSTEEVVLVEDSEGAGES